MAESSQDRTWWLISVGGYGAFEYFGNEKEAEDMRAHKANWEGGVGRKRRATPQEAEKGLAHIIWRRDKGYPLDDREAEAIRNAA